MKEVLTKSFWKGVKKTFDEALEGPPPADKSEPIPAESDPNVPSNSTGNTAADASNQDQK